MRTVFLVLTLVLTLGLGVASAQSAEEAAINEVVEGVFAAVAKGDAMAIAAYYTENAVRALGTNIVVGRANIEKANSEAFADGGPQITYTRHATHLLSPTTAIMHGAYEVTSATPPIKGHRIFTLVKEGAEWLIAANQTGAAPAQTSAQSVEGVWERVDIVFEGGPNPRTLQEQGFGIFMDGHFIVLEVNGLTSGPRPVLGDSPTDAEILAVVGPFAAVAGTYETTSGSITLHPTMTKVPFAGTAPPAVFELEFQGNDSWTSAITNSNGVTQTRRYVRVD